MVGLPKTEGLPLFEMAEKERILDLHEDRHPDTLDWLRREMRDRYFRTGVPVNANDAREVLAANGIDTGPWMGALFRTKEWENTGETAKSTAPGSHARILWCYRYLRSADE